MHLRSAAWLSGFVLCRAIFALPAIPKSLLPDLPTAHDISNNDAMGPAFLSVRGVPVEVPFQLKILLREFSSFSKEAEYGFRISGLNLHDQRQAGPAKNSDLQCSIYKNPLVLLNSAPFEKYPQWICRGKNYQSFINQARATVFTPQAGFISAAKKLYRGSLEVLQKEDKLLLINNVPIEPYLAGLANKEMNSNFPPEAVKAQVIAARSYALATAADRRREGHEFDLFGTEEDQVYEGTGSENASSYRLVAQTRNQVLLHQGEVLRAFYHSSNGGFSELPQEAWANDDHRDDLAYLARSSAVDTEVEGADWSITITPRLGLAWPDIGEIKNIKVLSRSIGKRVQKILVEGERNSKVLTGNEFRKRFGPRFVKSNYFSVTQSSNGWIVDGHGWGHGVGLSQLGAKKMAEAKKTATEILQFYYPFASIGERPLAPSKRSSAPTPTLNLPIQAR